MKPLEKEASITGIATFYVLFLLLGGFAVFTGFTHSNSSAAVIGSIIAAAVAIGGTAYAVRRVVRTFHS